MNKERLKQWLRNQLFSEDKEQGPVCKLILRHLGVDNRTSTGNVFQVMIPHNAKRVDMDHDELEVLANDIEADSAEDAEGIGGVQKYQLMAFRVKSRLPVGRFTFRMSGSEIDEYDGDGSSEPANQRGHMAQMMRHNEALMRISVMGANQSIGLLNRTVAKQADQIDSLMGERFRTMELLEQLVSKKHERELATKESENREERYQQLFEKGNVLLPLIANKIAGRKVLPEHVSPEVSMTRALFETMSQAQMSAILPHLRPEQRLALIEVLEKVQDEEGASDDGSKQQLPEAKASNS